MRFLGTDGAAKLGLAPQNTVHQLKRLIGKRFADPAVQSDIARLPFNNHMAGSPAGRHGSCTSAIFVHPRQMHVRARTRAACGTLPAVQMPTLRYTCMQALELSGLSVADLSSVELVGGSTRVPAIVK